MKKLEYATLKEFIEFLNWYSPDQFCLAKSFNYEIGKITHRKYKEYQQEKKQLTIKVDEIESMNIEWNRSLIISFNVPKDRDKYYNLFKQKRS